MSKIKSVIFGVGSLFNVWGNQVPLKRVSSFKDDCNEIKKDFDAVGKDMKEILKCQKLP